MTTPALAAAEKLRQFLRATYSEERLTEGHCRAIAAKAAEIFGGNAFGGVEGTYADKSNCFAPPAPSVAERPKYTEKKERRRRRLIADRERYGLSGYEHEELRKLQEAFDRQTSVATTDDELRQAASERLPSDEELALIARSDEPMQDATSVAERPTEPGVWFRGDEAWWIVFQRDRLSYGLHLNGLVPLWYSYIPDSANPTNNLPTGNWSRAIPAQEREVERQWIRKKLNLAEDTPFVSGAGPSLAGEMHVVCSNAHGYQKYIVAHECDDKQGEIARQSVKIEELTTANESLARELEAARGEGEYLRLAERVVEIFQPMQDKGQNGHTFELLLGRAKDILKRFNKPAAPKEKRRE